MFESRRRWTPELARQFVQSAVRVRGFDSLPALHSALPAAARAVAIVELDAAPADCLRWLASQMNDWPRNAIIVVGSHRTAEFEPLVRELGAVEFVLDTVTGESLARICRRLHATDAALKDSHA